MQVYNRELSWLAFNDRVLQEACDKTVPLMERLRFLGIFSNNQDEFIKVRVANLMRLTRIKGAKGPKTVEGFDAGDILAQVYKKINSSHKVFEEAYAGIISEMEKEGIYVLNELELNDRQREFCRDYFSREVSQWVVPVMLRKSTPLPFLSDTQIYHAIRMSSFDTNNVKYAILKIPVNRSCPRFVQLPSKPGSKELIFLDDVIRLCLDEIFFMFGYDTITAHSFKITRDAILTVDDDISKSLIEKMEEGLEGRLHGRPVRLGYDMNMPEDLLELLVTKLKLKKYGVLPGGRYHMMRYLTQFPAMKPELENVNSPALYHPDITHFASILNVIREKDIFLNYPYQTFNYLIDFLREAAIDPKVTRICITLYRTAERSRIINALINAADNGKEVVVLEELMARFDEEQNIENSDILQKAGILVLHGFRSLKVHCKLILVERKEKGILKGYTYIGTGNFNEETSRIYCDFGLFTSHTQIAEDARGVFAFLLDSHKHQVYKQLLVAPYFMREKFTKMIEREIHNSGKGKKAYIYAKFNSLTDMKIIRHLYRASQAGVEIRLIIRGACCLVPQVKGQSENIRVISIVDKYLEHSRLFIFGNNGNEQVYISSADWMLRNLDNRVEVAVPVLDKKIRQTVKDIFNIHWSDNVKARELTDPMVNRYVERRPGEPPLRSQIEVYNYYKDKQE